MLKAHPWRQLAFPIACLAVFALGALLRLQPWREPEAQAATAPGAALTRVFIKLPPGMGEIVFNFYERVDRGAYDEAYKFSLENKWTLQSDGAYAHAGLTPLQEWMDALTIEMGQNGGLITVPATEILAYRIISPTGKALAEQPELAILNHLPAGLQVQALYEADVSGWVGDICTPARFDKRLILADFGGGQWRVLLPGGPRPEGKRKPEWFTNTNFFADKQVMDERTGP